MRELMELMGDRRQDAANPNPISIYITSPPSNNNTGTDNDKIPAMKSGILSCFRAGLISSPRVIPALSLAKQNQSRILYHRLVRPQLSSFSTSPRLHITTTAATMANRYIPRDGDPVLPLFSLKGKTAIVSGAGAGIGLAVADAFAEAGANVAIWYNSNTKAVERAQAIAEKWGVSCACEISVFFNPALIPPRTRLIPLFRPPARRQSIQSRRHRPGRRHRPRRPDRGGIRRPPRHLRRQRRHPVGQGCHSQQRRRGREEASIISTLPHLSSAARPNTHPPSTNTTIKSSTPTSTASTTAPGPPENGSRSRATALSSPQPP